MTVSEDVRLPAQPTDGFAEYIPLGGDGFRTPQMLCNVYAVSAGDASVGTNFLTIRIDPAYLWVIDWLEFQRSIAAAPAVVTLNISPRTVGTFNQSQTFTVDTEPVLFTPAPMLMEMIDDNQVTAPRASISAPNVDGEDLRMTIQMFAFDKRAREFGFTRDIFSVVNRGVNTAAAT